MGSSYCHLAGYSLYKETEQVLCLLEFSLMAQAAGEGTFMQMPFPPPAKAAHKQPLLPDTRSHSGGSQPAQLLGLSRILPISPPPQV